MEIYIDSRSSLTHHIIHEIKNTLTVQHVRKKHCQLWFGGASQRSSFVEVHPGSVLQGGNGCLAKKGVCFLRSMIVHG